MLLPRKELDDSGNIVDPRTDLVSQLIEYKKIKSVLTELEILEENRSKIHLRGNNSLEFKFLSDYYGKNAELEPIPIYKLFSVFRSLLSKMEDNKKVLHSVNPNKYKIEDQKILILNVFQGKKKVDFKNVFVSSENRMHAVVIFLSLLEMLTDGIVGLLVGLGKNNFWVTRK
jgi:segregation and condensation protein A